MINYDPPCSRMFQLHVSIDGAECRLPRSSVSPFGSPIAKSKGKGRWHIINDKACRLFIMTSGSLVEGILQRHYISTQEIIRQ